jgi:hypothetical protein
VDIIKGWTGFFQVRLSHFIFINTSIICINIIIQKIIILQQTEEKGTDNEITLLRKQLMELVSLSTIPYNINFTHFNIEKQYYFLY